MRDSEGLHLYSYACSHGQIETNNFLDEKNQNDTFELN